MSRRDENRAQRRQQILSAARRLISSGGIDAVTMRGLAAEAGVAVNTVYAVLGKSRDSVLEALVEEGLADLDQMMHEKDIDDPLDLGPTFAATVVDFVIERNGTYAPALLAEAYRTRAGQGRWGELRALGIGADILAAAAAEGLLEDDVDIDFLAQHMLQSFHGLAMRWAAKEINDGQFRSGFRYAVQLTLLAASSELGRPGFRALLREAEGALGKAAARRRGQEPSG